MIGGALIFDKYGNKIHLMYLNLLRHQHIHRSRTTINDLITSYYHTIPEPKPHKLYHYYRLSGSNILP